MSGMTRVRGKSHATSASVTRPADTTTYASGDVVGDGSVLTFANASFGEFDGGIIQQAIITSSSYTAAYPDLELWLFNTTVTADADNAVFTPTDAEMATLVGVIDFADTYWRPGTATAGSGGNMCCVANNISMPFNTKKGTHNLFGVLVVRSAYVPIASEVFNVRLQILD